MKKGAVIASVLHRYCAGFGVGATLLVAGCELRDITYLPYEADTSFRDQGTQIGSTTAFNAQRFLGNWRVRYAMRPGAAPYWVNFGILTTPEADFSMQMQFTDCEIGTQICSLEATSWANTSETEWGRFQMRFYDRETEIGYVRDYWVLWVDEGFRTAALGAPDGSFAWILDRRATGGADRIAAAREVLDFNGYDLSQLKVKQ